MGLPLRLVLTLMGLTVLGIGPGLRKGMENTRTGTRIVLVRFEGIPITIPPGVGTR